MIEKLLKPFLSETGKLVLAAMEKWGASTADTLSTYGPNEPEYMYEQAIDCGSWVDTKVLSCAAYRIKKERKLRIARERAEDIAGKILMGDKFEKISTQAQMMNATGAPYGGQLGSRLGAIGQTTVHRPGYLSSFPLGKIIS